MPSVSGAARPAAAATIVGLAASVHRYRLLFAVFALALIGRAFIPTNADVSWLITIGEKVLDGAQPYIDFIEVNPPASILLYLPAVALARILHLSPEFVVGALVFVAAGVSLFISARIAAHGRLLNRSDIAPLAALFAAALLVLPMQTFGQREHIALIAFIPALAVYALRAERKPVALHWAIAAGIGAGLAVIIKPHLVLAVLFAASAAAIHARSWRSLFAVENWIAGIAALGYAALVLVAYPAFLSDVVPLVAMVYVPVRTPLVRLLTEFATPIFIAALALIWWLKRGAAFAAPFGLLVAAAFGFAAAFYVQQKGWPYHSYPMLALALIAAVIALFHPSPNDAVPQRFASRTKRLSAAAIIALFAGAACFWLNLALDLRGLARTIEASAPRPTMLNISSDIAVGHPLVRDLRGSWVSRVCSQWITTGALIRTRRGADAATAAHLSAYAERDRALLVEDIARGKPDIILVDRIRFDWLRWAMADAALARQLGDYTELATIDKVLVLRRNPFAR